MSSGVYSALSGAICRMQDLKVTVNNLSNVNNIAFKKDETNFEALIDSFRQTRRSNGINFTRIEDTYTDFSSGEFTETDRSLDLAIEGDGFFKVADENGFLYTRNGSFELQPDGSLVTRDGMQVVGENGPIILPDSQVEIDQQGNIWNGEAQAGKVDVYRLEDLGSLQRRQAGYWAKPSGMADKLAEDASILQGRLEMSNVDAISLMVDVIEARRTYQAYLKNIQAYGTLTENANKIGQLG